MKAPSVKAADLFCGAGGTSTGLVEACNDLGMGCELTAINHWPIAVETHSANHPDAKHLCAELDSLNPRDLYGENELDLLWASPECTHHSNARGGKPMNEQSRATAWCVVRWADALRPGIILIENVKEFLSWGPIGSNGKPLKSRRGEVFHSWVGCLESLGYRVDWRVLCAADYGDPTTRERLFVYAVRGKRKIIWPEPSHAQVASVDLLSSRKRWVAAREIIDWSLEGRSIFGRKKPLAEKTLNRIMIGLQKFGLKPFTVGAGGPARSGEPKSIERPLNTVLCKNNTYLTEPYLIKMRGTGTANDIDQPSPTVTGGGNHLGLVEPFLVQCNHGYTNEKGNGARTRSTDEPLPTVAGKFYGTGISKPVSEPLDTLTTKARFGLVMPLIEVAGETYKLDIRFRMLKAHELSQAQGFPKGYKFSGTTTEIVKQIGNAVPKNLAKALVRAAISQKTG